MQCAYSFRYIVRLEGVFCLVFLLTTPYATDNNLWCSIQLIRKQDELFSKSKRNRCQLFTFVHFIVLSQIAVSSQPKMKDEKFQNSLWRTAQNCKRFVYKQKNKKKNKSTKIHLPIVEGANMMKLLQMYTEHTLS